MTDDIEQLRAFAPVAAALQLEVQTLQNTIATWERACANYVEVLKDRDAMIRTMQEELLSRHSKLRLQAEEIERLRDDRSSYESLAEMQRAEIERLRDELAKWTQAADEGHPQPCTLGPKCPYCEIERLWGLLGAGRDDEEDEDHAKAEIARLRRDIEHLQLELNRRP
jgi:chromosome segregation ATPase